MCFAFYLEYFKFYFSSNIHTRKKDELHFFYQSITLINLSYNLREHKTHANLLYAIFDCKYLIENKQDFDWNIVIENTKLTKAEVQINLAMKFINKISTNILPKELQCNYYSSRGC